MVHVDRHRSGGRRIRVVGRLRRGRIVDRGGLLHDYDLGLGRPASYCPDDDEDDSDENQQNPEDCEDGGEENQSEDEKDYSPDHSSDVCHGL